MSVTMCFVASKAESSFVRMILDKENGLEERIHFYMTLE